MTNRTKQKIMRLETLAKFPYLIEVTYYDASGNSILERYANCDEDITYWGNVYTASFFSIKPPSRTNSSISDGKLTFSAVDQTWIEKIRNCSKRAKIRFIACIMYDNSNNVSTVEAIDDIDFTLTKCTWNDTTIEWTMLFDDRMNLMIPIDVATVQKVPGLA